MKMDNASPDYDSDQSFSAVQQSPDPVDDLEEKSDLLWENLKQLKLRLKYERLYGPSRKEGILKAPSPDTNVNFVSLSEACVADMIDIEEFGDDGNQLQEMLDLAQAKIMIQTSLVHTSQLTCSIDATKDMRQIRGFIDMICAKNRPVGTFGQGKSPAEALKKAINTLHAHYVQKK